jgi:hypothetical protein
MATLREAADAIINRAEAASAGATAEDLVYLAKATEAVGVTSVVGFINATSEMQNARVLTTGDEQNGRVIATGDAEVARVIQTMGNAVGVLTTKGDLLAHNGTGAARVPVGTVGQVLTVGAGNSLLWAAGSKFLKATTFIDRARRSTGSLSRSAIWTGTVNRISATSLLIVHFNAPQHSDSGNGTASPYFAISGFRKHTINQHGPGPAGATGLVGVIVFSPTEGLGATTGNLSWDWGIYSYDNSGASRGNITNPTNSDDSRLWPDGHQEQSATSIVIYEIEP